MTGTTYSTPKSEPSRGLAPWLIRLPLLAFSGAILFTFLTIFFVAAHQLQFDGLIYPGVSAYGVPLSGMTRDEAASTLAKRYTYGAQAVFTFRDGDKSWQMSAADLGVSFDPKQAADLAYNAGRDGSLPRNLLDQWRAWVSGKAITPTIVYDQSRAAAFLQKIAADTDRPMQDATILLTGVTVKTTPSQIGRDLDVNATLGLLRAVILNLNTGAEIQLIIHDTPPRDQRGRKTAAAQVRAALSSAIQLYVDGTGKPAVGPWQIEPGVYQRNDRDQARG